MDRRDQTSNMPTLRESIKTGSQAAFRLFATELIDRVYETALSPQSEEHLAYVAELLRQRPELSFILYGNHIANSDGLILVDLYLNGIDPERQRTLILPASFSHTDTKKDPIEATLARMAAESFGVTLIPIVQTFQAGTEYSRTVATGSYRNLITTIRTSKKNGPCDLIIFPEGHRAEDSNRSLQTAENGISHIIRAMHPAIVLPIGFIPLGNADRGMNFGRAFELNVGEPFLFENKGKPDINVIMDRLANLLPAEMRGEYGGIAEP